MVTKLFACVVAGALLLPVAALGKDGNTATQWRAPEGKQVRALPLPPIPYLETIPWLSTEDTGPRISCSGPISTRSRSRSTRMHR
jgi:hypothetical protein